MSRRPVLAANWKMNMLREEAASFCAALASSGSLAGGATVAIFPSAVLLDCVREGLAGTDAQLGGQDVHPETAGAHTGDHSAAQLRDAGCTWALCGHSERRQNHGEDDRLVARKAAAAQRAGLRPMVCLGETRGERSDGATLDVLERQLAAALEVGLEKFALAYEPVWAIGTGETATPEIAQEAHAHLRSVLGRKLGKDRAEKIPILYGGSAKPENVEELYDQPDIDGFLIGGASLDPNKFSAMITSCSEAARGR
ncbi:MAG: triose-phosphate isomerase [Acidobacteriota bacterium]